MLNLEKFFDKGYTLEQALSLLLVEDDIDLRNELFVFMQDLFSHIDVTDNAKDAFELYKKKSYDLVLSDIKLPNENGLFLVKQIKNINPTQIVIVMSAYKETEYFIKSIELGLFSFLVKPFSSQELMDMMFRVIKVIKERKNKNEESSIKRLAENITFDLHTKYLCIDNKLVSLTQKEEKLLYLLVKNIDGHISEERLRDEIWEDDIVADSTVRVLVKRLREKLGYEDAILNLKGRGYKITIKP